MTTETNSTNPTDLSALTGDYDVDPVHSTIGFVARHAMVTKVRGHFATFTGTAHFDGADASTSSVDVTIEADSIDTGNADRDGHLRSNDFLDLASHPQITFVSTSVAKSGEDTFEVTGDLTIRGVTKSITVPFEYQGSATDPYGKHRVGFEGSTVIRRQDFGVSWNTALETGGVLVSDKVTLEIEVSAVKR